MAESQAALVVDLGHHTIRVGLAGDALPSLIEPSVVGRITSSHPPSLDSLPSLIFPLDPTVKSDGIRVEKPYDDEDAEVNAEVCRFLLEETCNHVISSPDDGQGLSLLFAETAIHNKELRQTFAQILFEELSLNSLMFCKRPALAAYGCGRISGLVLDCGHSTTTVAAVSEGFVVPSSVQISSWGGEFLSNRLGEILSKHKVPLTSTFSLPQTDSTSSFPFVEQSFSQWSLSALLDSIKETHCSLSDATEEKPLPEKRFTLPDGSDISLPLDTFRRILPELLFQPDNKDIVGIGGMIADSLRLSDNQRNREIGGHLVVTGGSSLFPSFLDRLNQDLPDNTPSGAEEKIRGMASTVIASDRPEERRHTSWIGGSVLGCLGSYPTFCTTRDEFLEYGVDILDRRSP